MAVMSSHLYKRLITEALNKLSPMDVEILLNEDWRFILNYGLVFWAYDLEKQRHFAASS